MKVEKILSITLLNMALINSTNAMEKQKEVLTTQKHKPTEANYVPQNGWKYSNPLVKKVEKKFEKMPIYPTTLAAWNNGTISYPLYLFSSNENGWGINNHFQGIVRLPEHLGLGQYLAISGSNPKAGTADLFIVKLESQNSKGLWNNNISKGKPAIKNDALIKHVVLDNQESWHPGGMQTCGKYLAIPLEGQNPRVIFYDMLNPENPKKLGITIDRSGKHNSGSVALTRLENGLYFVAIWSDSEGFDFYISTQKTLKNGTFNFICNIPASENYRKEPQYNAIHFVQDTERNLYLIGTDNPSKAAPIISLPNIADLFLVHPKKQDEVTLELKQKKEFPAVYSSNFDAGCGIYIPDSDHMWFYACNTFLSEFEPNCCQYCCSVTTPKIKTFLTFDQYGEK